jgi:hypothetical protein
MGARRGGEQGRHLHRPEKSKLKEGKVCQRLKPKIKNASKKLFM